MVPICAQLKYRLIDFLMEITTLLKLVPICAQLKYRLIDFFNGKYYFVGVKKDASERLNL